jgi:hypothetical protein
MVSDGMCDRDCEVCELMREDRNVTPCLIDWASDAADDLRSAAELA